MARMTQDEKQHQEIKEMIIELKGIVNKQGDQLTAIQHAAVERSHLDKLVTDHEDAMHDNGKVGLKTIRNEWIKLVAQKNAIIVAIIVQAILMLIFK